MKNAAKTEASPDPSEVAQTESSPDPSQVCKEERWLPRSWTAAHHVNTTTNGEPPIRCAAAYIRYSTDQQNENSVERQTEKIRAYASRINVHNIKFFIDRGFSGADPKREALQAMMRYLEGGTAHLVIVEQADRLARSNAIFASKWERLEQLGIELHDTQTGHVRDHLTAAILGALPAAERARIAARTQFGREKAAAAGSIIKPPMFGYATIAGHAGTRAIVAAEANIVREVFEMCAGGASLGRMVRHLQKVCPTRNGRPRRWFRSTLKGMLRNPLYMGMSVYKRTKTRNNETGSPRTSRRPISDVITYEVPDLQIIDPALWRHVQDLLPQKEKQCQSGPRGKFLLRGKIPCPTCGHPMMGGKNSRAEPRVRWKCLNRENGSCEDNTSFFLDNVERQVLSALRDSLTNPEYETIHLAEGRARRQEVFEIASASLAELAKQKKAIERQLDMTWESSVTAGFTPMHVASIRTRLSDEWDRLEAEEGELRDKLAPEPKTKPFRTVRDSLNYVISRAPFVPNSPEEWELSGSIRSFIRSVLVTRADEHGAFNIRMELSFDEDAPEPVIVHREIRMDWNRAKIRNAKVNLRDGCFALSPDIWSQLLLQNPYLAALGIVDEKKKLIIEGMMLCGATGISKSALIALYREQGSAIGHSTFNRICERGCISNVVAWLEKNNLQSFDPAAFTIIARPRRRPF